MNFATIVGQVLDRDGGWSRWDGGGTIELAAEQPADIALLLEHDPARVAGKVVHLERDATGVYAVAVVDLRRCPAPALDTYPELSARIDARCAADDHPILGRAVAGRIREISVVDEGAATNIGPWRRYDCDVRTASRGGYCSANASMQRYNRLLESAWDRLHGPHRRDCMVVVDPAAEAVAAAAIDAATNERQAAVREMAELTAAAHRAIAREERRINAGGRWYEHNTGGTLRWENTP